VRRSLVCGVFVVVLTGCSGAPSTTPVTPSPAPGQWAPFTTPLLPPVEVAPPCTSVQLGVTVPTGTVRRGHVGATIFFRNNGETACNLRGYPGVAGLDSGGAQVAQATWTMAGFLGGVQDRSDQPSLSAPPPILPPAPPPAPPPVTLQAGQYASAMVEALDAELRSSCRYFPALLVTPPDARSSIRIPVLLSDVVTEMPDCGGFEVHPVTAGRSGGVGSTRMLDVGAPLSTFPRFRPDPVPSTRRPGTLATCRPVGANRVHSVLLT
jgi:hypothetical protein